MNFKLDSNKIPLKSGCTIVKSLDTIAISENPFHVLCIFCYKFCLYSQKSNHYKLESINKSDLISCSCNHEENPSSFKELIINFFQNIKKLNYSEISIYNNLLSHKIDNQSILQFTFEKNIKYFHNRNINELEEANSFLELILINPIKDSLKLYMINVDSFLEIIPLKFIYNYFELQKLYKDHKAKIFKFFEQLLKFFLQFYLKRETFLFRSIHYTDLERSSITTRVEISIKNPILFENLKLFKDFNLFQFIKNAINKLLINFGLNFEDYGNSIPILYLLKIIRICVRKRLFAKNSSEELDIYFQIIELLYDKIDYLLLYLEKILGSDESLRKNKKKIKQYYAEIFIQYISFSNDSSFIIFLEKEKNLNLFADFERIIYVENLEKQTFEKILKKIKNEINFKKVPFFNEEKNVFNAHMYLSIFFGFVQNGLKNKKTRELTRIFMSLFANKDDFYSESLNYEKRNNENNEKISVNIRKIEEYINNFSKTYKKALKGTSKTKKVEKINNLNDNIEFLNFFEKHFDELCYNLNIEIWEDLEDIGKIKRVEIQDNLFNYNIIGIMFTLILKNKNSNALSKLLKLKMLKILKYSITDNINNQYLVLQSDFLNILQVLLKDFFNETIMMIDYFFKEFSKNILKSYRFFDFVLFQTNEAFNLIISENSEQLYLKLIKYCKFLVSFINWNEELEEYILLHDYDRIILEEWLQKIGKKDPLLRKPDSLIFINLLNSDTNAYQCDYLLLIIEILTKSITRRIHSCNFKELIILFPISFFDEILKNLNIYSQKKIFFNFFCYLYVFSYENIIENDFDNISSEEYMKKNSENIKVNDPFGNEYWVNILKIIEKEFSFVFKNLEELILNSDFLYIFNILIFAMFKIGNKNPFNIKNMMESIDIYKRIIKKIIEKNEFISTKLEIQLIEITEINQNLNKWQELKEYNKRIINICSNLLTSNLFPLKMKVEKSENFEIESYLLIENIDDKDIHKFSFAQYKKKKKKSIVSTLYELFKIRKIINFSKLMRNKENNQFFKLISIKDEYESIESICKYFFEIFNKKTIKQSKKTKKLNQIYFYQNLEIFTNIIYRIPNAFQQEFIKLYSNNIQKADFLNFLQELKNKLIMNINFLLKRNECDLIWEKIFEQVILLLKFHQYLIEENNFEIKEIISVFDYTSIEIENKKSDEKIPPQSGLIEFLCDILKKIMFKIDFSIKTYTKPYLLQLLKVILQLLSEFVSGGIIQNQRFISQKIDVAHIISFIINDQIIENISIKLSMLELLNYCLEGKDNETLNIHVRKISNFSDIFVYLSQLVEKQAIKFIPNQTKITLKDLKFFFSDENVDSEWEIVENLYVYLNVLKEKRGVAKFFDSFKQEQLIIHNEEKIKQALYIKFLSKKIFEIEVIYNDKINIIQFSCPKKMKFLTSETKGKFLENVNRENRDSKLADLINTTPFFEKEIKINEELSKKHSIIFRFFGKTELQKYEKFLFVNSLLINMIILCDDKIMENDSFSFFLIEILAIIQIIISFICLAFWFLLRFQIESTLFLNKYCEMKGIKIKAISKYDFYKIKIHTIFNEKIVLILFLHLICSLIGITTNSYGFLGITLLSLINLSPTLKYIATAFTLHGSQLVYTFVLVLVLIYIYGIFSFEYFSEQFTDVQCSSILYCYLSIISVGLTNGSGIIGMTEGEELSSDNIARFIGFFILTMTFFVFINSILMSTVYGIITNTFSEMSQNAEIYEKDYHNICFICQIEKSGFEKNGNIFKNHINNDHNVWKYVAFIIHMRTKNKKNCNGIEGNIYDKIEKNDYSWIPNNSEGF